MTNVDFIKKGVGSSEIAKAQRQQKQLQHFLISDVQEDISIEYINTWANKKFVGADFFLNFVKTVFKTENFLSFYKYLRYPLASSILVREQIIPELQRVFHADDSYFEYFIKGEKKKKVDDLMSQYFAEKVFEKIMYSPNDVIVTKLDGEGKLKRDFVSIDEVVSVEHDEDGKILKIAYVGSMYDEFEEKEVEGKIFIDDVAFEFYPKDSETPTIIFNHEIGVCPADYVSCDSFFTDKDWAVRYSIFSTVREKLEEYVFLKTIQRMTEPNGAIPVISKLKTNEVKADGQDVNKEHSTDGLPLNANIMGPLQNEYPKETLSKGSIVQAGTIFEVPALKLEGGGIDMAAVQNFLKFFYMPVESLDYLRDRITQIERDIIRLVVGDYSEGNESAKNEKQVSKSFVSKQDKLRNLSRLLTTTIESVENKSLALLYGKDQALAHIYFGSDFFIESKAEMYEMIKQAPNPIERKNLLVRLSGINNKFNKSKAKREKILYLVMPYSADTDFDKAVLRGVVTNEVFQLQTRFSYWIGLFEANYGEITTFWENLGEASDSEKIIAINNLLIELVTSNTVNTDINE